MKAEQREEKHPTAPRVSTTGPAAKVVKAKATPAAKAARATTGKKTPGGVGLIETQRISQTAGVHHPEIYETPSRKHLKDTPGLTRPSHTREYWIPYRERQRPPTGPT